jgi:hypothetical protein
MGEKGVWGWETPRKQIGSFLAIFQHMVFTDGFLIPVKELGLLTDPKFIQESLKIKVLKCSIKQHNREVLIAIFLVAQMDQKIESVCKRYRNLKFGSSR